MCVEVEVPSVLINKALVAIGSLALQDKSQEVLDEVLSL